MKELKTKGSLTIFAAICIVFSVLGGMACIPAAKGMNGFWHMLFPQYVENNNVHLILRAVPATGEHSAPAQYLGPADGNPSKAYWVPKKLVKHCQ
jgi:ABC-type lipoprotein release transport system permease subunit